MWNALLDRMLRRLIRIGDLHVVMPDGLCHRYGDGSGAAVKLWLHSPSLPRKILQNTELAVGEAYADATLTIENDDLYGFLTLGAKNLRRNDADIWWRRPLAKFRVAFRHLQQHNPVGKAQANVARHYDLSRELYDLFLDEDKQYSCAYFRNPDDTLEQAQAAKKSHIANKLLIKPGMRVLDIGCGWGGMALTLARDYGARVVGVTLSKEQHAVATHRAAEAGLSDRVEIRLMDYRHVTETYDRIVSVGMFEHVGVPHYREYFNQLGQILAPDGVALIHTIGRSSGPGITSPWILKYIFPGGYAPALSETMSALEQEALTTADIEVWRLHYAETLKHWHDRFVANIDAARDLYDDRFCRMWRYYLIASELTFRNNQQVVFQLQLAHKQDAVPLTRDYLYSPQRTVHHQRAAE